MPDKDFVVKNGLVVSNSTLRLANNVGVVANNSLGLPGQVLTSNGTAVFWATGTGNVNTSAQFTWNNTQFYSANLVLNSTADLVLAQGVTIWASGSSGNAGSVLTTDGQNVYWGIGSSNDYLTKSQNLADLPDKGRSRTNLGLGAAATQGVGFAAGQVAPGDQTPSRTGTGASGTWNINVSGSSGSTNYADTANVALNLDPTRYYQTTGLYSRWRIFATSPNDATSGALTILDAAGDPDKCIIQATDFRNTIQYGWIGLSKTGQINSHLGPIAVIPTYKNPILFRGNTWYQAPADIFVTARMCGPYTNIFYAYVGENTSTFQSVGIYGDDINNNTKWATITFYVRKGYWFQTVVERDDGEFQPRYFYLN